MGVRPLLDAQARGGIGQARASRGPAACPMMRDTRSPSCGRDMDAEESVALVVGARAGDRLALTRLVAVLTPVVQARVARTLLARRWGAAGRDVRHEVEDLGQEIF